jgi:hypothetical protein
MTDTVERLVQAEAEAEAELRALAAENVELRGGWTPSSRWWPR